MSLEPELDGRRRGGGEPSHPVGERQHPRVRRSRRGARASTRAARRGATGPAELEGYRRDPRRAVGEAHIVCLVCGVVFRQLTNTHIRSHGMTPLEYKIEHGYHRDRPLMCHELRRAYAERAAPRHPADRPGRRPVAADPRRHRRAGPRPSVLEEYLARRETPQRPQGRWSLRDGRGRFSPDRTLRRA